MRALLYVWAFPNTLVGLVFVPFLLASGGRARVVDGVLELHGPLAKFLLRRCVPIRGGATAMTFGHVVIGRDATMLALARVHERVHVRQCEVWGPIFLPAYLIASLWGLLSGQGAYMGNYFEREAWRHERTSRP